MHRIQVQFAVLLISSKVAAPLSSFVSPNTALVTCFSEECLQMTILQAPTPNWHSGKSSVLLICKGISTLFILFTTKCDSEETHGLPALATYSLLILGFKYILSEKKIVFLYQERRILYEP